MDDHDEVRMAGQYWILVGEIDSLGFGLAVKCLWLLKSSANELTQIPVTSFGCLSSPPHLDAAAWHALITSPFS